jgi:UDP-N-acetylglucosamine 2-epimerase (non-hydrolysing)
LKDLKKILIVFGTRPEAIKMAPLLRALQKDEQTFKVQVWSTGQHKQLLDQVLDIFNIKPDLSLEVMDESNNLSILTSKILTHMSENLTISRPDLVLVHGDTTTAFATALASFYNGIPIGHVEAGLRTNNSLSPFPEEFNRAAISRMARFHFAPTVLNQQNLLDEKIDKNNVFVTGNTVVDALCYIVDRIETDEAMKTEVISNLNSQLPFAWAQDKFILITGHRRENFGTNFKEICKAILTLAIKYPEMHFIYPVHLNPKVNKPVKDMLENIENIHLIAPQDYVNFTYLLKHCQFVLTDSGGVQEEAPTLGKPVLVMRDATERTEAISSGTALLVGSKSLNIVDAASNLIENHGDYQRMSTATNPFGDGVAAKRIVDILKTREY